ncbi:hypothetical protein FN846DRAFT_1006888 [Sphaerosporella brunnea]|uniref:HTH APSES-type domain-containing protein n=1 Tax=Sphaerosporella brunnea TaxID=1250544 RepID=A0A5J5FA93_9PEZI|nr:hypothetical protein FN846DRAFT_1006888 [Sphaerosporella brunnea]
MSLNTRDAPPAGCSPLQQPSRLKIDTPHSPVTIKQEQQQEDISSHSPHLVPPPPPTFAGLARTNHRFPIPTPVQTPQLQMRRTHKITKPKERMLKAQQPQDTVNYRCHEPLSEFHRQKIMEMDLFPSDGVATYTRRIPFKGQKNALFEVTGRHQFDVSTPLSAHETETFTFIKLETSVLTRRFLIHHILVYEYRFTAENVSGEKKQWWVMWDYYTGLVRVHDFFDCCKPGKTEPGNALKEKVNPGLNPLCPNITGGNLHAQGYWIPYEAAKALAAKFCYKIRFALTPIFGDDFPNLCLPEDHEDFGKYNIDPAIVVRCQQRTEEQKLFELKRRQCEIAPTTLISTTCRYATPADSTPGRSSFQITSPQMASMPSRTIYDPVRDDYTTTAENQQSEFSSPSGLWPSAGPIMPTSSAHHERQILPGLPSMPSYYHHEYASPEITMTQRMPRVHSSRQHPYPEFLLPRDQATASRSPGVLETRSPHLMLGSPAESLISCDPSHVSRIPSYSYLPPATTIRQEYPPIYPPLQGSMQESNSGYHRHFASPPAHPERHESPIPQHEADLEHGSKRRRVSGQLSSPSVELFEHLLKDEGEYAADRMHRDSTIPMLAELDERSPQLPPMLSAPFDMIDGDAERDVAEAAAGLMDLRRKDTELEENRRYST